MQGKMTGKKPTAQVKPHKKTATLITDNAEATTKSKAFLSKVPAEYVFWCNNGCVFSDLEELAAGLAAMSNETYAYHCNPEKQDFVNWVRDVVKDEILAVDLARAVNRIQAAEYAAARIAILARNL